MAQPQPAQSHTPAGEEVAGSRLLASSMADAEVLIWYASRAGVVVEESVLKELSDARKAWQEQRWNADCEAGFWTAMNKLARAISPVSVTSIQASAEFAGEGYSETTRTARRYRLATLGALLLLLACQIYWLVGNTIIARMEPLLATFHQNWDLLERLEAEKEDAGRALADAAREIERLTSEADETTLAGAREQLARVRAAELDVRFAYSAKDRETERVWRNLEASRILLDQWHGIRFWDLRLLGFGEGEAELVTPAGAASGPAAAALRPEQEFKGEMVLFTSRSVLSTFNQYVLPLLYGLVGALAYILRTLSREISQHTYVPANNLRYTLRWPLGMLAGITVGWFFDPAAVSGVASIQPLALAFLAGYSVELLFTGLDRLVGAFTDADARSSARG